MRSVWTGHVRFSLIVIGVKMYNALETSDKVAFNQLHSDCLGPVGYDKRCKKCAQVLTGDQIVKGYQYEPEKYVVVKDEDVATIKLATSKVIDIIGFVSPSEIPTTFFDQSYFIGPDGPASDVGYALLRDVMKKTGKVAIGKVVMRDREDIVTLSPDGPGLVVQKLHFQREVRSVDDVPKLKNGVTIADELALAENLVEKMSTSFQDIEQIDRYHEGLKQMLARKITGKPLKAGEEAPKAAPKLDIMAALKASLDAAPKKKLELVKGETAAAA